MTTVMTAREYAEYSGADLESLEAAIREAQADEITRESMDASTLQTWNFTAETEEKMRHFAEIAKDDCQR